ncbi:MAG TPA: hypothetical protein VN457_07615, partial [Chlamydiales bacterium]|nr:hypothetical protein [Chlamydiales bacterium]
MHYLLLFFFLVTTPTPTPTTTATKQCTLQDTVIVTETFEVPADMEPNVHMLQQSIEERIDDFELISIEARKKDATHLSLRFGLRP